MSVLTVDGNLKPLGYEQITSLSTVQELTPPDEALVALIQATDQNVRWRDDFSINAVNPSATVGLQLLAGKDLWYTGDLSLIKFIEESASAKLNVSYYIG